MLDAGPFGHPAEQRRLAPIIAERRAGEAQERGVDVVRRHRGSNPIDVGCCQYEPPLVSWFRNSLHSCRESFKRISEPNDTTSTDLLVSFDSEVRIRECHTVWRTS